MRSVLSIAIDLLKDLSGDKNVEKKKKYEVGIQFSCCLLEEPWAVAVVLPQR